MSPNHSTCPASIPTSPQPSPIPPPPAAQGCIPTLVGQDRLSEAEDESSEQQGGHLRDPAKGTQPHTHPVTAPGPRLGHCGWGYSHRSCLPCKSCDIQALAPTLP